MMDSKSLTWLMTLAALWAALMAWQWLTAGEQPRVPLTNVSGGKVQTERAPVPSEWQLKPLPAPPESPPRPKRNLFAPLSERQEQLMLAASKPVKRKESVLVKKSEPTHTEESTEAATVSLAKQEPAPPPPPSLSPQELAEIAERQQREQRISKLREQASQYRLLGFSERGGVKQAFVGKGGDIYVVRHGDQLDGIFTVFMVEPTGVKIREAKNNVEHTIEMKKDGG